MISWLDTPSKKQEEQTNKQNGSLKGLFKEGDPLGQWDQMISQTQNLEKHILLFMWARRSDWQRLSSGGWHGEEASALNQVSRGTNPVRFPDFLLIRYL